MPDGLGEMGVNASNTPNHFCQQDDDTPPSKALLKDLSDLY